MVKQHPTKMPGNENRSRRRKYPRCPLCGGVSARIVYGLIPPPSPEEEADMVPGGCQAWFIREVELGAKPVDIA